LHTDQKGWGTQASQIKASKLVITDGDAQNYSREGQGSCFATSIVWE